MSNVQLTANSYGTANFAGSILWKDDKSHTGEYDWNHFDVMKLGQWSTMEIMEIYSYKKITINSIMKTT